MDVNCETDIDDIGQEIRIHREIEEEIEKQLKSIVDNMNKLTEKVDELEKNPRIIKHYHYKSDSEEEGDDEMEEMRPMGRYVGVVFGVIFVLFSIFNVIIDKRNADINSINEDKVVIVTPVEEQQDSSEEEMIYEDEAINKENMINEEENILDSLFAYNNNEDKEVFDFKDVNISKKLKEKAVYLIDRLKSMLIEE